MQKAEIIRDVQDFINRELQKQGVDLIDAITWEQTPHDLDTRIRAPASTIRGMYDQLTFPSTSISISRPPAPMTSETPPAA